jgi:hypothetical protein
MSSETTLRSFGYEQELKRIAYVLINADTRAKVGGIIWLVVGAALLVFYRLSGRGTELSLED